MTIYSATILLTELMMLAMTLHVVAYPGFEWKQKRWYLLTFITIMLCAAAEWAAEVFDGRGPEYVLPLTIITVMQFSLTPLIPVFFAGALGMGEVARPASVFFAANVLLEIMMAPSGRIFYFDKTGTYFHGDLYILYEVFYIISVGFLLVALVMAGKRFKNRDILTIVMVLVVMAASIVPLILYSVHADYIGIAISACLCYIYYNDLVQQDVQTALKEERGKIISISEHIVSTLANLIESRDLETGEHVARTSEYVRTLSECARRDGVYADVLTDDYIALLEAFAPLHDVGKIVVSDSILRKPGRLTPEEFEEMKKHASAGGRVVREILDGIAGEEQMKFASDIAMYHHEKWDGSGYPEGLSGTDIPLAARIMAIADVYDALVSERCYKKPMTPEQACRIIEEDAGKHFDPQLAKVFLDHREEFEKRRKAS